MFRLYCGLVRDGKWFNKTEVHPLDGGILSMLNTVDKSGGARILSFIKGSIDTLYSEEGDEYTMKPDDYQSIYVPDSWKIGYEQIKSTTKNEYPIIPEYFFCPVCSRVGMERFTKISESWQSLSENGEIDEIYAKDKNVTYKVTLPDPIVIDTFKTISGGSFSEIIRSPLTIGDMIHIHKDQNAMMTETGIINATWDASIVSVAGMPDRDFNLIKRIPGQSFSEKYVSWSAANIEAMQEAERANMYGWDASFRSVTCQYCNEEIGGYLDFTNFFQPLLPSKLLRQQQRLDRI